MASLRRTLGDGQDGARYIVNISGRGYSFVAPIERNGTDTRLSSSLISVPQPGRQFPSRPRLFVGRDETIESLSTLLMQRRFVSIVGAGGIGKTAVAAAIVSRLLTEFGDDNVAFVDLGAVSEPGLVPGAIISAVGCALAGTDPAAELLSFIAGKRLLIVLDSCEHLLDVTSVLASRLFQHSQGIHLLVTSRESLRVEGETVHLLSSLACPVADVPSAEDAMAAPAVQLFMDRASLGGFERVLDDADAPVVSEICRRTDGIALAIQLVASRVGAHGIQGVANLLANEMELSLDGQRNVAPRHRTLQAMLDWSFKLLSENEQKILSRLSMLVGLFTMEAACSIAGDGESRSATVATTIARLVDKSLVWVHPVGETVFYRLPDTTRVYAAAKLEEIKEFDQIAQRHAVFFSSFFNATALEHGAYADIGRYAPHIGNVRKALKWSFSAKENRATGVELAADAAPLFLGLWLLVECRHWSGLALSAIKESGELPHREARLQEAYAVSSMHTSGNTPVVRNAIQRGLELYEAYEQALPQLRLLAGLNLFLTRHGDFEGGLAAATKCRDIAERSGSLSNRIIAEWMLAAAHHLAGDQATAVLYCERGFELEATIGRLDINLFGYDHHLRAEIALARSLWLLGSPQRGCRLALEAMDEAARLPPPGNYCMAVVHAAPVLLWSGNAQDAAEHIERAITQAEKHSLRGLAAAALALKGEWLSMTGRPAAAVLALRQALKSLYREQFLMTIPAVSRALADGLSRSGRHDEARTVIRSTISSAERMGQKFWMPNLLRTQAEIVLTNPNSDYEAATFSLRKSIDHAQDLAAVGWKLKAAVPLARLLKGRGRGEEARALLQPILDEHTEKSGSVELADAQLIMDAAIN
ncbi:Predicted ATPase [Bradyrhizobium sp. cf659]|nr:Predicted ATPase [Bradyrhizobium sp. cf659]